MRRYIRQIFLWSWVITVPISLVGSYLLYRAVDRTYTYSVRYGGEKEALQFARIVHYEASQLANFLRVNFIKGLGRRETSLKSVHLVVPEANLAQLESHMPQSGFEYVKGRMIQRGQVNQSEG